jgi:HlyD family secretion protein
VEFIVEQRRDILVVPNAALRYQPSNLSAEAIAAMVFAASLKGMSAEDQRTAQAAREQAAGAQAAAASSGAPSGAGLAGIMGGGAARMITGGGGRPGGMPAAGTSGGTTAASRTAASSLTAKTLWRLNSEGKVDCIQVLAGISDGTRTEIHAAEGELEGMQVILREKV